MKSIEIQAKTIEEAVEQGLAELGLSYDQVEIEVINGGGMFKKAKVKLTSKVEEKKVVEEKVVVKPEAKPKPEPKPVVVKETKKETTPKDPGVVTAKYEKCLNFVTRFIELSETEATVTGDTSGKDYKININGEDVGRLIGKGGEAIKALQTIVSSIAIANSRGDNRRVYVNIENYNERRTQTLKDLAKRKADFVLESGKSVKLDPMSPRERAIIHTELQNIEGIKTFSQGEGNNRRLVIALADGKE